MICLNNTDTLEGGASVAAVVDYQVSGLVGSTFTNLAAGQLSDTDPSVLYTAGAAISVVSVTMVNTHSSAVTVNLYLDPVNGGNPRRLIPEDVSLGIGFSLVFDGQRISIMNTSGGIIAAADYGNHASNHTDGTDDIQSATNAQKGVATAAHITAIEANTADQHTQDTDTALGTMVADIDMDGSYQVVGLQAPAAAGEALRQTVNITEADLEQLTDGSDTTLHDHDGISENSSHTAGDGSDHQDVADLVTLTGVSANDTDLGDFTETTITSDSTIKVALQELEVAVEAAGGHVQGTDTTLGTMTADIDMDNSYQIVNLQAPAAAGEALRQTVNITEADLEQLTDGSDTTLHDHDGISENSAARHTAGSDTALGTMAADIDMDNTYQVVNLQAPAANGEALRATTNITEADLEQLTDGSDTTLHDHDGIAENTAARHTQDTDTALGTLASDIDMGGQNIDFGAILTVNGTYKGTIMTVTVDDASSVFSSALYCAADFHYERCDADAAATMNCVCLAIEAANGSKVVLLEGQICNTAWDWSAGPVYVSGTIGALTQTAPAGTGDQVQIVGFALSADTIYFRPDSTTVEIA